MPNISIYTPTHNAKYLREAHASLKKQTFQDFEWVIVPNGNVEIPNFIHEDPRVRLAPFEDKRIGALKGFAVSQCRGQLLVELDHDDYLVENCLAKLWEAYNIIPDGFYFSDCVNFWPDQKSETFSTNFGWQTYPFQHNGHSYSALRCFDITARSLAEIEFCPNHVRAWSRVAYEKSGGYNRELGCADDHELMCRTYLTGVPFLHIPEVLYFYRRHEHNSFESPEMNEAIHKQSIENMNAYLHPMIFEWCRRRNLKMYDLGGAHNCPPGFEPIDMQLPAGVTGIRANVLEEELWRRVLSTGNIGCFRAVDFMEHIPGPKVPWLMNQLYDALVHEGWLITETPAFADYDGRAGWGAVRDPTHVSFWVDDNWRYYTDRSLARFLPEVRCKFQEVRIWTDYPSEMHFRQRCPYVFADLCAGKGDHNLPGGLRI